MSSAAVRIQAGTRLIYDGDAAQVVELLRSSIGSKRGLAGQP